MGEIISLAKDYKNLIEFMEKFKVNKGYIISKNEFKKIFVNKKEIEIFPAWRFALMKNYEN